MAGEDYDVIIVGGGPAGSTTGALLRKYAPKARVLILERELFPREHVGESQLPPIGAILEEMGCWGAVEEAQFPIKVGLTLRWGRDPDLWDFNFIPNGELTQEPRPAPFAGQRQKTALQVDRAIYDDILLKHAASLGCEVREQTKVAGLTRDGDRITGLTLADGETLTARWYVDASGHPGALRRSLDVKVEYPAKLKNVAVWDYWDNAEWADTIGVGGTRVQVLSLDYGWLWFIPVSPTRSSVGLIVPAEYLKSSGQTLHQLYARALGEEPRVAGLLAQAQARGETKTTKDWSFLADRSYGDNWFLVGEAIGFADPILAAGMTLAQTGGRELAHSLVALLAGEHDAGWLARNYDDNQRSRIQQHIRFADFWYASNGQFSDLQEQCKQIAADSGLTMTADEAWRWLAQGGFANDTLGQAGIGGLDLAAVKQLTQRFTGETAHWRVSQTNMLKLALQGATKTQVPYYRDGKVIPVLAFDRDGRRLLLVGLIGLVAQLVGKHPHTPDLLAALRAELSERLGPAAAGAGLHSALQGLELLLGEGWVVGSLDPSRPRLDLKSPDEGAIIHGHREIRSGSAS